MNILPKKRWHVRTKDNIARVRRDEAEAREKERVRQEKLEFAESEARINFLRKQSGLPERQETEVPQTVAQTSGSQQEHVDLFADYKTHIKTTNKELEKEKKEEKEKYEKQIGYLTYLGQDTNEALKLRSWYEVAPSKRKLEDDSSTKAEKDLKNKFAQDPLTLINVLLPPEKPKGSQKIVTKPRVEAEPVPKEEDVPAESSEAAHKRKKSRKEKKHKREKHKKKKHHKEKSNHKEKHKNKSNNLLEEQLRKREKLEQLRKERLRREASERSRQEALLAPKESVAVPVKDNTKQNVTPRVVQKYNSQFNPELAKQNML